MILFIWFDEYLTVNMNLSKDTRSHTIQLNSQYYLKYFSPIQKMFGPKGLYYFARGSVKGLYFAGNWVCIGTIFLPQWVCMDTWEPWMCYVFFPSFRRSRSFKSIFDLVKILINKVWTLLLHLFGHYPDFSTSYIWMASLSTSIFSVQWTLASV